MGQAKDKRPRPRVEDLEKELEKEREKTRFQKALQSTVFSLVTVAAIAVLISTFWMPVLELYGSSMTPVLEDGDVVIAFKKSQYKAGDIVGLYYGNNLLVKRIIGGPGQMIDIDPDGQVYVNGQALEEDYLQDQAYGDVNIDLPYQVPENRWFVMGDHRSTSVDSRHQMIGSISDEQMAGKLVFRIWPLESFGRID